MSLWDKGLTNHYFTIERFETDNIPRIKHQNNGTYSGVFFSVDGKSRMYIFGGFTGVMLNDVIEYIPGNKEV